MIDILKGVPAILFYIYVVIYAILSHLMMRSFEDKLRLFETDADLADKNCEVEAHKIGKQVDQNDLIFAP